MQLTRKISVFIFAFVIFMGSIGVNVFAHFCKVDGVDYSYMVPSSHACAQEKIEESCCHAPKKEKHETEAKKNCCNEEVKSFRISSELLQKSAPELHTYYVPVATPVNIVFAEVTFHSTPQISFCDTRPPPKKGQEILILHQVFRI